ncbi:MAG: acryloyl-CoA reductase, partial [Acidobacteria bacterium]|nr:acryloyl-CoA reductase [Acidobacteriota bacterium]
MIRALMIRPEAESMAAEIREIDPSAMPEGDTTVQVLFSSLNYKDGLAITGKGKIIRGDYPFVPGIDLIGRVAKTSADRFSVGDLVIQNGWGLGESHWGGFATEVRTRAEWLVPLPAGLNPRDAAIMGTAGYTAMLAVMALEDHHADKGEVLVSGASGGLGSVAVHLLSRLGYRPVASTGKTGAHGYLRGLGAAEVEDRAAFSEGADRPMKSARWAGAIDNVGGRTLESIIAQTASGGTIASCGNAGGIELHTTVLPFILRGVTLAGIDSNFCPTLRRERAWKRLSEIVTNDALALIDAGDLSLEDLPDAAERITRGEIDPSFVITHRLRLDDAPHAYRMFRDKRDECI